MYLRSVVLSYIVSFNLIHVSSGITSSDDRFVKKYAMMKVYESCYGPEVLKEVRKEMKAASAKCSTFIAMPSTPAYATSTNSFKVSPHHSASSHFHKPSSSATLPEESKTTPANNIDIAKLQQIILAGYKNVNSQQQHHPQQQSQHAHLQSSQQQSPYSSALQQQQQHANSALQQQQQQTLQQQANSLQQQQQTAAGSNSNILQQVAAAAALSQLPAASQNQLRPYFAAAYNNPVASALGSMFYPGHMFGGQGGLNPFFSAAAGAGQINPYTAALYSGFGLNPFFPGRSSRDMDLRQLEGLSRMTGKVKNVTCVMQELGYLDSNLEPDYVRMVERINRLPVSDDLKRDMTEGVEYCRQFSSCVPDERHDKLAREMIRPMFFFRCYKHKKLESCIMKDIRERYSMAEDLSDDTFGSNSLNAEMRTYTTGGGRKRKTRRNNKNKKFDEGTQEDEAMSNAMFNFLYGGEEFELDSLL